MNSALEVRFRNGLFELWEEIFVDHRVKEPFVQASEHGATRIWTGITTAALHIRACQIKATSESSRHCLVLRSTGLASTDH